MPTGYTAHVQDGKITTLRDFALKCSRAFGALISMRDDSWDATIPTKLEPDTKYYDEGLAEAQTVLSELPSLSLEECNKRAQAEFDEQIASHVKYETERALSKQRYEEMKGKVERWKVDEELVGLKDFMLKQLEESISFDCSESYRPEPPVRLTGERWREQKLERASKDVAYHTVEREKEIQRTNGRNKWLKSLLKSLPEA